MYSVWIKIVHFFVLLVTVTALVGVNVKQLYCHCLDTTNWEVELLPVEREFSCDKGCCDTNSCDEGCCDEGCCDDGCCDGGACHDETRHDFYKITDYSLIESDVKMVLFPFDIAERFHATSLHLPIPEANLFTYGNKIHDLLLSREFLCSYVC